MNYTPKLWSGTTDPTVITSTVLNNKTLGGEEKLVRLMANVKSKTKITALDGDLTLQAFSLEPTFPASQITINDVYVTPEKYEMLEKFDFEMLRQSRFSEDMAPGANNTESNEFLKVFRTFAANKIGSTLEKKFWVEMVDKMAADSDVIKAGSPAVLTSSNLVAELEELIALVPAEVSEEGQAKIYGSLKLKKLIGQANRSQTYRDLIRVVSHDEIYFDNYRIHCLPLGVGNDNTMIVSKPMDLIWATDVFGDEATLEVGKTTTYGNSYFLKSQVTQASAYVRANEKVLYKPAA